MLLTVSESLKNSNLLRNYGSSNYRTVDILCVLLTFPENGVFLQQSQSRILLTADQKHPIILKNMLLNFQLNCHKSGKHFLLQLLHFCIE